MISEISDSILKKLKEYHQGHLVSGWENLSGSQKKQLEKLIETIDFAHIDTILNSKKAGQDSGHQTDAINPDEATSPANIIRFADQEKNNAEWINAKELGEQALKTGRVGAVLVAGGQGTRLGFPYAKGMFGIGPLSGKSLFQIFTEQLLALSEKYGTPIPYFIMTSDANHNETVAFFEKNQYFGYESGKISFFKQGLMPSVDKETGKILLSATGEIGLNPDGHGGLLNAIENAGLIQKIDELGVEYIFYHQVDNPTVILCDPILIGYHIQYESEMTTKVVAKRSPDERMGVVCDYHGETRIIEYSDMSEEVAFKKDASGNFIHWAGNMAIHVFDVKFIKKLLSEHSGLPVHVAHKAVPFWDHVKNEAVSPVEPNAFKFEKFIFDALPFASKTLVVEADRAAEFNPVKNAEGNDSPEQVKKAMSQLYRTWLHSKGVEITDNVIIEISPLYALTSDDLEGIVSSQSLIDQNTYYQ